MAYEPTSAVSQGAAAGAATFGTEDPNAANNRLGFAGLLQRRNEAAGEREDRATDRNMQMQQFQAGQGMQQQGLDLQKSGQEQSQKQFTAGLAHTEKMAQADRDHDTELMNRKQRIEDNRKILELEFAQATGEEREALAKGVMSARAEAADIDGKIAAKKMLLDKSITDIAGIRDTATEFHKNALEVKNQAREYGSRAGKNAVNEVYQGLTEEGNKNLRQLNDLDKGGYGSLLQMVGLGGIDAEGAIGIGFLKPSGDLLQRGETDATGVTPVGTLLGGDFIGALKQYGGAVEGVAKQLGGTVGMYESSNLAEIDDNKIKSAVNQTLAKNIGIALSKASDGKGVNVEQVNEIIDKMARGLYTDKKTTNDDGTPGITETKIYQIGNALSAAGLSSDVIHSTFMHMADGLDGTDTDGAFNVMNLTAKRNEMLQKSGGAETVGSKALEASIKFAKQLAAQTRTMSLDVPEVDLNGVQSMLRYLNSAAQGRGGIKRNELEAFIPEIAGSNIDQEFRENIRQNRGLSDLERYQQERGGTTDILGDMDREFKQFQGAKPAAELRRQQLEDEMANVQNSPRALAKLLAKYKALGAGQ